MGDVGAALVTSLTQANIAASCTIRAPDVSICSSGGSGAAAMAANVYLPVQPDRNFQRLREVGIQQSAKDLFVLEPALLGNEHARRHPLLVGAPVGSKPLELHVVGRAVHRRASLHLLEVDDDGRLAAAYAGAEHAAVEPGPRVLRGAPVSTVLAQGGAAAHRDVVAILEGRSHVAPRHDELVPVAERAR